MLPSTPPTPTANPNEPPLNAITEVALDADAATETPEERTARHLRLCQEVLAHGMILLRAASARALQDIDPPELETPIPGSAASSLAQAQDRARRRVPNNAVIFARLSRAVRQTIALQALIAAGYPPPRAPRPPGPDSAPRTAPTGQAAADADPANLRRGAAERPDWRPDFRPDFRPDWRPDWRPDFHPDWRPTFDPDSQTPVEDLLHKIRQGMDQAHAQPPPADDPPPTATPRRHQPSRRPPASAAPPTPRRRPPIHHHADG